MTKSLGTEAQDSHIQRQQCHRSIREMTITIYKSIIRSHQAWPHPFLSIKLPLSEHSSSLFQQQAHPVLIYVVGLGFIYTDQSLMPLNVVFFIPCACHRWLWHLRSGGCKSFSCEHDPLATSSSLVSQPISRISASLACILCSRQNRTFGVWDLTLPARARDPLSTALEYAHFLYVGSVHVLNFTHDCGLLYCKLSWWCASLRYRVCR